MSFTLLQKVALNHADSLVNSLDEKMRRLSQEHNFVNQLCTRDTTANDMAVIIRVLDEIVTALRQES